MSLIAVSLLCGVSVNFTQMETLHPNPSLRKLNNITRWLCIKFHENQETEQKCICPSTLCTVTLGHIRLADSRSQGWDLGFCIFTTGSSSYDQASLDHGTNFVSKYLLHEYHL